MCAALWGFVTASERMRMTSPHWPIGSSIEAMAATSCAETAPTAGSGVESVLTA